MLNLAGPQQESREAFKDIFGAYPPDHESKDDIVDTNYIYGVEEDKEYEKDSLLYHIELLPYIKEHYSSLLSPDVKSIELKQNDNYIWIEVLYSRRCTYGTVNGIQTI